MTPDTWASFLRPNRQGLAGRAAAVLLSTRLISHAILPIHLVTALRQISRCTSVFLLSFVGLHNTKRLFSVLTLSPAFTKTSRRSRNKAKYSTMPYKHGIFIYRTIINAQYSCHQNRHERLRTLFGVDVDNHYYSFDHISPSTGCAWRPNELRRFIPCSTGHVEAVLERFRNHCSTLSLQAYWQVTICRIWIGLFLFYPFVSKRRGASRTNWFLSCRRSVIWFLSESLPSSIGPLEFALSLVFSRRSALQPFSLAVRIVQHTHLFFFSCRGFALFFYLHLDKVSIHRLLTFCNWRFLPLRESSNFYN